MSTTLTWHQKAARLQAERPYWTWTQVCAELQRRSHAVRQAKKSAPPQQTLLRLPYKDD